MPAIPFPGWLPGWSPASPSSRHHFINSRPSRCAPRTRRTWTTRLRVPPPPSAPHARELEASLRRAQALVLTGQEEQAAVYAHHVLLCARYTPGLPPEGGLAWRGGMLRAERHLRLPVHQPDPVPSPHRPISLPTAFHMTHPQTEAVKVGCGPQRGLG